MKSTVIRYGVISGLALAALGWVNFIIAKSLDYTGAVILGYTTIILALTLIYFGMRYHRDQKGGGYITFRRGFVVGILIALVASAFSLLNTIVFFSLLGEAWISWARESLSAEQLPAFEANLANPLFVNPFFQGLVMFMTVFLIGLIIAVISALILQRRP